MRQAIAQLYEDRRDLYLNMVARRAGGKYNAEDVVQEAFKRALLYEESYNPTKSGLETWFEHILRKALYDFQRDELLQGMTKDDLSRETPETPFLGVTEGARSQIRKEIDKKEGVSREVLWLTFVKGFNPRDIVSVLDVTIHNTNKIIQRFRKEMVDKYGED